jgi:hypothetical protein
LGVSSVQGSGFRCQAVDGRKARHDLFPESSC